MVQDRENIDQKYKWDVESVYQGTEEWEKDFEDVKDRISKFEKFKGNSTGSAQNLLDLMVLYEAVNRKIGKINRYARMKSDEDTRKSDYQALNSRADSLKSQLASATSFISPEIQEAGRKRIEGLMEEERELENYDHFFDDILRRKKHTRSAEVENVISGLGDVLSASSDTFSMLTNADLDFGSIEHQGEEIEVTKGNFTKLLQRQDRELREKVYRRFYDKFSEVENTIGSTFEKNIIKDVRLSEIKDFDSARKRALNDSKVPTNVYDNLVEVANENTDKLGRHMELKRKVLDRETLDFADIYMPLTESESPEISYEEAKKHVLEAIEPLGEEYQKRAREGLNSGWVDVYENKGKRSGAYSGGSYDTKPFILMNFQDDISGMFTLAHELGHSMHSDFTNQEQPYVHSHYKIFVAEVASTVNEILLAEHLLKTVEDEKFKRHVLSHFLENFRNTFFRQTLFAEFEKDVHEEVESGQALTTQKLDGMYGDLKEKYFTDLELDEHIKREWMRIPHFYYNFYVYQYSTGIASAIDIAERILDGDEETRQNYIEFLKSGGSDYPLELLKKVDVDLTEKQPLENAVREYENKLEKMEKLL